MREKPPFPVKDDTGRQTPEYARWRYLIKTRKMAPEKAAAQVREELRTGKTEWQAPGPAKKAQVAAACPLAPDKEASPENRCWSLMIIAHLKKSNEIQERIAAALDRLATKHEVKEK